MEKIRPLIQHGHASILYDIDIENSSLQRNGSNFLSLVNSLPKSLSTRWFIAIKNYTIDASTFTIDITICDCANNHPSQNGVIPDNYMLPESIWLSFSGSQLFDSDCIRVTTGTPPIDTDFSNCHDNNSLVRDWPIYEASPKHRREEYLRKGVIVSAMDLDHDDAQAALLIAAEHEGSRYSLVRGKIYRFIATNPGGSPPIFHGFRVDPKYVPQQVFDMLEP